MKALKKWALILGLAGPAITNFSCSGGVWQQFRDAALAGAANYVEQATFDFFDANLSIGDTEEVGFFADGDK